MPAPAKVWNKQEWNCSLLCSSFLGSVFSVWIDEISLDPACSFTHGEVEAEGQRWQNWQWRPADGSLLGPLCLHSGVPVLWGRWASRASRWGLAEHRL